MCQVDNHVTDAPIVTTRRQRCGRSRSQKWSCSILIRAWRPNPARSTSGRMTSTPCGKPLGPLTGSWSISTHHGSVAGQRGRERCSCAVAEFRPRSCSLHLGSRGTSYSSEPRNPRYDHTCLAPPAAQHQKRSPVDRSTGDALPEMSYRSALRYSSNRSAEVNGSRLRAARRPPRRVFKIA